MLINCSHLLDVWAEEANVFNEKVSSVANFRDIRHFLIWFFFGGMDFREMLLHGEAVVEPMRPHLELLHQ